MWSDNFSVYGANARLRYSILVVVHTVRGRARYLADGYLLSRERCVLVHRLSLLVLVAQLTFVVCRKNSFSSQPSVLALSDCGLNGLSKAVITKEHVG
jgi:hypothetical protein